MVCVILYTGCKKDNDGKSSSSEIAFSKLTIDFDDELVYTANDDTFTGECTSSKCEKGFISITFKNGKPRKLKYFHKNGQIGAEAPFAKGTTIGTPTISWDNGTYYNAKGKEIKEEKFDEYHTKDMNYCVQKHLREFKNGKKIFGEFDDTSTEITVDDDDEMPELAQIIREGQSELPMDMGSGMTMTGMDFDGNYIIYTIELDEYTYDMDDFKSNRREIKQNIIQTINNGDESTQLLIDICKLYNVSMKYIYVGDITGESLEIPIYLSDMN